MLPWLKSILSDTECCTMRNRPDQHIRSCTGFPSPAPPLAPRRPTIHVPSTYNAHSTSTPPNDEFFVKLAELCVNDPQIAMRISDDRTSSLIWGEARSPRFRFLQMCIRDQHHHCREMWPQLMEFERRDLMSVYHHGPPSRDFFLDIMVNDELSRDYTHFSDCGSSSSARSDSRSDSTYISVRSR